MKASKRTLFDCVSFPAQTKLISTLHVGHVSIYTSHAAKLSYPYIIRYLSGDQNSTIKESSWTALIWLRNLPFSQIPSCPRSLSAKLSNHFFKATNFILDHLALPLFSSATSLPELDISRPCLPVHVYPLCIPYTCSILNALVVLCICHR